MHKLIKLLLYSAPFCVQLFNFLLPSERLYLKQADILENKTSADQVVKILSGNVVFKKGDLTLKCDQARQFEMKDISVLYDNVSALKNDQTLTCDTIKFFSSEDKLLSIGKSHIWDRDYDLNADTIIVFTNVDSGLALGNVSLVQKGQTIRARRIEYQKSPRHDGVSYVAIGNVIIEDSMRIATCGRAIYDREKETTTLKVEPKISTNSQVLKGEKILLEYRNEQLAQLDIPKKALVTTKSTGYQSSVSDSISRNYSLEFEDQMEGSSLVSFFKDGEIDSIQIAGMARTLYHVFEDSIYQGRNDVSGDTIKIKFSDKDLKNINIIGGSEGKYQPDSLSNDNKSPISYKANTIFYYSEQDQSDLIGNVNIRHKDTDLDAGFVNVNWKNNLLDALPRLDGDTITEPILPVVRESGRDPMTGSAMKYNLRTRKGTIKQGKTRADDGFYVGEKIRNESQEVFYIENSVYTTCDRDTAHFHFESSKMKIIQDDKVIARPIILHLGQIPIFGIPFGMFPHKGGQRHSGWIMPSYGDNKNRGQYIQGLGFYWAPSQYWDSKFTIGIGSKQGATFSLKSLYRMRYKFSGSINFFNRQYLNQTNDILDLVENRKTSTTLRWNHQHELRKNQSFNANVTYSTSGDYNKKYGLSEAERMDQKAISNISYSKRWPKSKNSFSTNYYSNLDLLINEKVDPQSNYFINPTKAGTQLNIKNATFPKFSFRHGQSNFFPSTATNKKWYNTITWNYGLNYTNTSRDYFESEQTDDGNFGWKVDSLGALVKSNEKNDAWIHTSTINAPQKLLKHISINPTINIKSAWVNKTTEGFWNGNEFEKSTNEGFATRTTGSFNLNASTQFYGLLPIPFGPIKAFRHVLSPSIGYSWTPDFSQPIFGKNLGYVYTETDSLGNKIVLDRFAGTMAGGTPKSERKSISFSLNNIFQTKIKTKDKEKKVDLMSWRMSSNYNFAADSLRLSNLNSSIRSKIAGKLNLDLSMTHDFYEYSVENGRRISKFNKINDNIISPRLINARFSTGFRLKGKSFKKDITNDTLDTTNDDANKDYDLSGPGLEKSASNIKNTTGSKQFWTSNISLSYNYSALNPSEIKKSFWANTTSTFNVTSKWKVSHRARFDLIGKNLVNHSFSIYRDLHCWELSVNWTPTGIGQGINFKLNVKSPTLQDLKIEKRGGIYSGAGF